MMHFALSAPQMYNVIVLLEICHVAPLQYSAV
jgi:hypothetical protein